MRPSLGVVLVLLLAAGGCDASNPENDAMGPGPTPTATPPAGHLPLPLPRAPGVRRGARARVPPPSAGLLVVVRYNVVAATWIAWPVPYAQVVAGPWTLCIIEL